MRLCGIASLLLVFSICLLTVSALNKNNNHFFGKIVSRAEEAVQKFESLIIHRNKTDKNSDSQSKQWAVLVAGSNGYYNYRHQVLS